MAVVSRFTEASLVKELEERGIAAIFTYGDTIHNPFNVALDAELIRHEETHMEQQEGHPDVAKVWWDRYIQDPQFRLDQEAEAYGAQYKLYTQLEIVERESVSFLFAPSTFGARPLIGYTVVWGGVKFTVKSVDTISPDGNAILSRIVGSR